VKGKHYTALLMKFREEHIQVAKVNLDSLPYEFTNMCELRSHSPDGDTGLLSQRQRAAESQCINAYKRLFALPSLNCTFADILSDSIRTYRPTKRHYTNLVPSSTGRLKSQCYCHQDCSQLVVLNNKRETNHIEYLMYTYCILFVTII